MRQPDVNTSGVHCRVEEEAVRIGLALVRSLREEDAEALVGERERGGAYADLSELARRSSLDEEALAALVGAGACDCLSGSRRTLRWELGLVPHDRSVPGSGGRERQLALPLAPTVATPELPEQTVWERMLADYRTTGVSIGVHPLALLRPQLPPGTRSSGELARARPNERVSIAGLVIARQRPATASGVVFMLIEDELGNVNLVVLPPVYERFRALVRAEPLLLVHGRLERAGRNENVIADRFESLLPLARRLAGEIDVYGSLPGAHHFGHR